MNTGYNDYEIIYNKLKQHEQVITQLLVILASSNVKISDLYQRQMELEQRYQFPQCSPHVNFVSDLSPNPFMTPRIKE